jgi:hypothetical protein
MSLQPAHIARICHEANRALCFTVGDTSQLSWDESPAWQRQSASAGVAYLQDHPNATSETLHANWIADKLQDGWIYGEVKNSVAKTHPCMVPYDQLPEFQRYKDKLFLAIVRSLLGTVHEQKEKKS